MFLLLQLLHAESHFEEIKDNILFIGRKVIIVCSKLKFCMWNIMFSKCFVKLFYLMENYTCY